jgi:hypothetical protein
MLVYRLRFAFLGCLRKIQAENCYLALKHVPVFTASQYLLFVLMANIKFDRQALTNGSEWKSFPTLNSRP